MRPCTLVFCILMAVVLCSSSASAVVYVKWDSPGPVFDGGSWETAYRTIQQGIDAASAGEEVRVAQGEYEGQVYVKSGRLLKGGYAGVGDERDISACRTIIRLSTYVVNLQLADGVLLDGFTVIGGTYSVRCDSGSTTITRNTISGAESYGIFAEKGSVLISHNRIVGNRQGVYCASGEAVIANNIIVGNHSDGVLLSRGSHVVTNNTIAGNGRGLTRFNVPSDTIAANNIIAFNSALGVLSFGQDQLHRNCVYGHEIADYIYCERGPTDIQADPQFVSLEFGDFHIHPTSPCRNAGDNAVQGLDSFDIDGQPRIQGGIVDIGADESHGEVYPPYTARILHVDSTAAAGGDGSTWSSAYDTAQAALKDCMFNGGAEIWVAQGIYNERITMWPFAHLYGGFNGTEALRQQRDYAANTTVIDAGDPSTVGGVITGKNMCTVDGFTIRGGYYGFYCYFNNIMIRNNKITENTSYGIYVYDYAPRIINNIIADNGHGVHIYACGYHGPWLINNTIVDNDGYGLDNLHGTPVVTNNIFAFNSVGVRNGPNAAFMAKLTYNVVYGNGASNYQDIVPAQTDIRADPLFIDRSSGDYHIYPFSPCRNAGDNSAPWLPDLDIDGQRRIYAERVDIGADESYGEGVVPNIIYVKHDSEVNGPGDNWTNAWRTIGQGMTAAAMGDEIRVAGGYYPEKVVVKPAVTMYGGYSGVGFGRDIASNETIIDARDNTANSRTISIPDSAVLDGFTVTGGYFGVYCLSGRPVITRNIVTSNSVGAYCGAGGVAMFDSNKFLSNGSGLQCVDSVPLATNNIFAGNFTGVYCGGSSAPKIIGNTIVDNTVRGILSHSFPLLANNLVAFNGTGMHFGLVGSPTLSHNNVYGSTDYNYYPVSRKGATDISVDPLFVNRLTGDYHLSPYSPCINAGDSSVPYLPLHDMDGEGRICWGAVDIGADELWPMPVEIDILPGEFPNTINLKNSGVTPVAVLTTADFNAAAADPATISLSGCPVVTNKSGKLMCALEDVDRDGDLDLVVYFETKRLPLQGATSASLMGLTLDGRLFEGTDSVVILNK